MFNQRNMLLAALFLLFANTLYAEDAGTITDEAAKKPIPSPSLTFYGEEFVVEAPKPSPKEEVIISKETIDAGQVRDSSVNLFNDLSETLKSLPGVITPGNFSGELYIRGGSPLETIYVLDRVFIDWPYRWGGMMTMFNTRLIQDVDFYAGGFPAEGGNSLAGVIDIKYKKGDLENRSGLLEISPTTTELLLEGPMKKGKSSYLFSAKRTYYDYIAKFFTDKKEATVFPYFNDCFSKLYFDLSPQHKLTIFGVYAGEGMDMEIKEEDDPEMAGGNFDYSYQTGILAVDHKWIPAEKFFVQTTLSHNLDKGDFEMHSPEYNWNEKMKPINTDLRSDLDWQISPAHKLRSGVYLSDNKLSFSGKFENEIITGTETLTKGTETKPYEFKKDTGYIGFYAWDRWQLSPRLTADIGLRQEHLGLVRDTALTPRVSLKFDISDKTSLKLACSHNSQFPINIYAVDEKIGNPNLKSQKGTDYILGMERRVSDDVRLKVETYYKDLNNLIVEDNGLKYSNKAKGRAYGLELFLQCREGKRLDGWISYSLSKSVRTRGDDKYRLEERQGQVVEGVENDTGLYPTPQDRRHTISVVGNYLLTPKWRLSGKWQLNTGNPYTPLMRVVECGTTNAMIYKPVWGEYNSGRMPQYESLDLKVERLFKRSSVYFQALNLYNHKNIYEYYYTDDFKQRKESVMLGFMFLGGFEMRF